MTTRTLTLVALLLAAILVVPACRDDGVPPGSGEPATPQRSEPALAPSVGSIDGEPVEREAFVERLLAVHGRTQFVHEANARLVEVRAEAAGIEVDAQDVGRRAAALRGDYLRTALGAADSADLSALVGKSAADELEATFLRRARTEALARKLLAAERRTDDDALRARFEAIYGPGGVRDVVSHLVFSPRLATARGYTEADHAERLPEVKKSLRTLAERLRAEIEAGRPLEEVAREHGDDRAAGGGGDLGTRWPMRFGPAFDAAVAALEPGQVSPVVEGPQGYHLIEVSGVDEGWRLNLRAIRIATPPADGRTVAVRQRAAETLAAEAVELARRDGFEAAVKRFSDDPRARDTGGLLPPAGFDDFGPDAERVLRALEEGQVSEPVLVGRDQMIFQIESRERLPDEDVKRVRHVLLSWLYPAEKRRQLAPQLDADARRRAEEALARLEAGEAFDVVARELSDEAAAKTTGGQIVDWRPGRLGPEADAAIAGLEVGEHSAIVELPDGLHVFRLDKRQTTAFEAVRDELTGDLARRGVTDAEVADYLARLRAEAEVEFTP